MEYKFLDKMPAVELATRGNRWISLFGEWAKTDSKCLMLVCKNQDEKRSCYQSIKAYISRNNLDYTVYVEKGSYKIYIVRS